MAFSPDQDRDKAAFLHDLCKIEGKNLSEMLMPTPAEALRGLPSATKVLGGAGKATVPRGPSLNEDDFEAGEPVEVRPIHATAAAAAAHLSQYDANSQSRTMGLSLSKIPTDQSIPVIEGGKQF